MMKSSRNNRLKASWICPHCKVQIGANQFQLSFAHPGSVICPMEGLAGHSLVRRNFEGSCGLSKPPTRYYGEHVTDRRHALRSVLQKSTQPR
jgi:hypothetical protein